MTKYFCPEWLRQRFLLLILNMYLTKKVPFRTKKRLFSRSSRGVGVGCCETGVCLRAVILGRIIDLGPLGGTERCEGLCGVTERQGHPHHQFADLERGGGAGGHLETDEPHPGQTTAGQPSGPAVNIPTVSVGGQAGVLMVSRNCRVPCPDLHTEYQIFHSNLLD